MSTIRAIVNHAGTAKITNVPYPSLPSDKHILVRPTAWAVNPVDHQHLSYEDELSCDGCQVGFDYAGVVLEVGSGVTRDFKKGDRVGGSIHGQ